MPAEPQQHVDRLELEVAAVYQHRYREARRAGLSLVEAALFADSDANVGELRRLLALDCPLELLRAIVL